MICEFLGLNQKISSLSESLEKAVNDNKVQNRNVDFFLHENLEILQNELAQKNEIFKTFMEVQSTVLDVLLVARNDSTISDLHQQQSQQLPDQINKRCMNSSIMKTRSKCNKINKLKIFNYSNNNNNKSDNNKVIVVKKHNIKKYSNNKQTLKTKKEIFILGSLKMIYKCFRITINKTSSTNI